jgi:hypothetical protein
MAVGLGLHYNTAADPEPAMKRVSIPSRSTAMVSRLLATVLLLAGSAFAQANAAEILGTVTEGERPQVGLTVVLTDGNGKVQGTTQTSVKGAFEFKNVAAGAYKVSSSKPVTNRKGSVDVNVMAGQTVKVTIQLLQ